MMYGELYQYLVLHKQLNVPGIGTFFLERKPADLDIANKVINPPSYTVALHHGNVAPSRRLFSWLSSAFNISEREAIMRFNDFVFDLKDQVMAGKKMQWSGVGTLTKGLAGEIRFEPLLKDRLVGEPVPAVKVLRENAEHTIRVGEDEKTSAEMLELLRPEAARRSYWWTVALILLIAAFIFVAWYLSQHGPYTSSTGNQQKIKAGTETATYKLLR